MAAIRKEREESEARKRMIVKRKTMVIKQPRGEYAINK